jgi:hypothetical protein
MDPVAWGAPAAKTNITSVAIKRINLIFEDTLLEAKYNLLESVFIFNLLIFDFVV